MSARRTRGARDAHGLDQALRASRAACSAAAATVRALDGRLARARAGRTLAIVGESGCGKSTLARQIDDARGADRGRARHRRRRCDRRRRATPRALRRSVQMVFQNPFASLNPRKKIGQALEEPLAINTA